MFKYPIKLNRRLTSNHNALILPLQTQTRNRHDGHKQPTGRISFEHEIQLRQNQARRSVFIQSPNNRGIANTLANHCSKLGDVRNIFQASSGEKSCFLVEFSQLSTVQELTRTMYHPGNHLFDGKIHARGRFITFTPKNGEDTKSKSRILIKQETHLTKEEKILNAMRKEKSTDHQIRTFYKLNRLSDLSSRLRFLTALQVEEALSGVFHEAQVLPFGSSVNGFGRMQSDLDMVLISNGNRVAKNQFSAMTFGYRDDASRNTIRNNLNVFSSLAKHWLHGVSGVLPILNARVPIIKYVHALTQLECDMSMGNISGYQMSEIMYTFGEIDDRVRPLVFFIRGWAKAFDVTPTSPNLGVSNFMLTTLVIFFLQTLPKPILPPSNAFVSLLSSFEGLHITNISKLNFKSENTSSLADLFVEFLEFYITFNYDKNGASITTGSIKPNKTSDSMYVYNPLEEDVNVCRNLNDLHRNQFIEKCQIARDVMVNNNMNVVDLLELHRQKGKIVKMNSFVTTMVKHSDNKKFNVKKIMDSS